MHLLPPATDATLAFYLFTSTRFYSLLLTSIPPPVSTSFPVRLSEISGLPAGHHAADQTPSPIRQATRTRVGSSITRCGRRPRIAGDEAELGGGPPGARTGRVRSTEEGVWRIAPGCRPQGNPPGAKAGRRKETANTSFLACHYGIASRRECVARTRRRRGSMWLRLKRLHTAHNLRILGRIVSYRENGLQEIFRVLIPQTSFEFRNRTRFLPVIDLFNVPSSGCAVRRGSFPWLKSGGGLRMMVRFFVGYCRQVGSSF